MTSYSNESYLFTTYNNENDVLTCNKRPICSTLQNGKYGSNSENIDGGYYGNDYGNSEYGGELKTNIDMNACYQKLPIGNTTSDYTATLNDNSLYDTSRVGTVQEQSMSGYMADIQDPGGGHYGGDYSVGYSNAYNGRFSALGDGYTAKMLPQAPIKQSSSMLDGMYTASGTSGCGGSQQWQQGFRASQKATPPAARSRMLPHPCALAGGVAVNDYAAMKRHRPLQQLNGVECPQTYINAASLQTGSGNVRILPQPHAPLFKSCDGTSMLRRQKFQDTSNLAASTTSTQNYFYDKRTINDDQDVRFNNSGSCDIYSWAGNLSTTKNSANFDIDNFCPLQNQQRPHTSMAPFNFYRDGDGDYGEMGYYADDNLSTYSDTPIALATTTSACLSDAAQQKLQQQRKLSLMMAMTTASVIASGETRTAPNKKRSQAKSTSPTHKGTEQKENFKTAKFGDEYLREYNVTSFVSHPSTSSSTTLNNGINYNSNNLSIAKTNTTNRASQFLSAATSASQIVAATDPYISLPMTTSTVTITATAPVTALPVARPTRARKLPKCLPVTPKSRKLSINDNTTTVAVAVSTGNKILPQIPVTEKSNNNVCEKTTIQSPSKSLPIATSALINPTHISSSVDTSTIATSTVSTTITCDTNMTELTNYSQYLATPDLSNNNSDTIFNNNSFDNLTRKPYSIVDDHKSSSVKTSNAIGDVYNIMPSSISQAATSLSSTISLAPSLLSPPSVSTSSTTDYLSYLRSYALQTEAKLADVVSSSNGNKMETLETSAVPAITTATTSTLSFLTNVTNSMPQSDITPKSTEFSDNLNKNFEPTVSSAVPEKLIDYSAYINSLTTTIASSPSTPLNEFSRVTESLVPSEASNTLTFTSNTYLDPLNSHSLSKFDDCIALKSAPVDDSPRKTNNLDMTTIMPSTYSMNGDVATTKPTEDSIPAHATFAIDSVSNDVTFTESYADYLKKFELPELPPLLTAIDTSNKSDADTAVSIENNHQESPSLINEKPHESNETENQQSFSPYIADLLKGEYESKYEFSNDYKINDFLETPKEVQSATESNKTTVTEEQSLLPNATSSTMSTTAISTPHTTAATNIEETGSYDFYSEYLKHSNDDYTSKYSWNVDDETLTPATSIALSNDGGTGGTKTTSTENFLPVSTSISTAFDDSFYDSFKVDLDTLTAAITSDEQSSMISTITTTTTKNTMLVNSSTTNATFEEVPPISTGVTLNGYSQNTQPAPVSTQGGYYRPPSTKTFVTSTVTAEEISKPPATSASAASKASSLIGGLSKGIKGSLLDGVLTGVGANQQQQQQQTTPKKGFGFNLASKLVPNVGGLLTGATASKNVTKPTTIPQPTTASTITVSAPSLTTAAITATDNSLPEYAKPAFGEVAFSGTEFLEDASYHYENRDEYCDVDYNNQQLPEYSFGMQSTDNTGTTDYDEYGVGIYSEYEDYNMANVYAVESGPKMTTESLIAHQDKIASTSAGVLKGSMGVTLQTTAANVTTQDQSLQQQRKPETVESKSGGMFGSFLGKAAAAMQSATQVVNQGAAAIVQQHKAPTSAVQDLIGNNVNTSTSTALNNAYNSQQQQQQKEHQDSLLNLQTYSSVTTAADTDYENSNMVAVYNHDVPIMGMNTNNYYSNGNQSQPPTVTTAKMLPTVPAVGKKLPNITNGSKPGIGYLIKQQPTEIYDDDDIEEIYEEDKPPNYLNDNSEHHDYYKDVDHPKDLMAKRAHINGYYEQHHSFDDPVGSSSGGYDYREDYFDEEDEYKYLEREAEAEQERLYRQQHKQQKLVSQHQKQSSSLEYIEESHIEGDDDIAQDRFFNDDNYPSEDSGNYLDESSSGSVGGVAIKSQRERVNTAVSDSTALPTIGPPIPATRPSVSIPQPTTASHQQIKKQESIIMEEDDKLPDSIQDDTIESPVPMTDTVNINNKSKAAFRRKSSDIVIDDDLSPDTDLNDRLGDLPPSTQRKKKVLIRGETEEVVSGHMQIMKRQKPPEVTAKQRWHWAYNKIIMQLNVSRNFFPFIQINFFSLKKYT